MFLRSNLEYFIVFIKEIITVFLKRLTAMDQLGNPENVRLREISIYIRSNLFVKDQRKKNFLPYVRNDFL